MTNVASYFDLFYVVLNMTNVAPFISNKEDSPILYYYGERWPSVHHARMRMGCSSLASDLTFNLKVISDPSSQCGADLENAHQFCTWPKYDEIRNSLPNSVPDDSCFVLKTLLYGDNTLSFSANVDNLIIIFIFSIAPTA